MKKYLLMLATLPLLALCACGGDGDDEPEVPDNPSTGESKEFVYNSTPLNDYIVSFAGDTKDLTTMEVLEKAASNFEAAKTSLVGTPVAFLPSVALYGTAGYSYWTYLQPLEYPTINDVQIIFAVYTGNISSAEYEAYHTYPYKKLTVSGDFHDGYMELMPREDEVGTHYLFRFTLAVENDVITAED